MPGIRSRVFGLVYGVLCYAVGMAGIGYLVLFLNNIAPAPRTIDSGTRASFGPALAVNGGLLLLFALQHTVMARRSFKRLITRVIPRFSERPTYVLASGLALGVMYLAWQPLPELVWSVESDALRTALWVAQGLGWVVLVAATFMLSHGELFGLQQVWAHLRGTDMPAPHFRTPGFYRFVRHPIQLGVLLGLWITPDMSVGRLFFAAGMTVYIVIALVFFEERDLVRDFGETYRRYQARVGMLLPRPTSVSGAVRPAVRP